jgi:hypothetical protein
MNDRRSPAGFFLLHALVPYNNYDWNRETGKGFGLFDSTRTKSRSKCCGVHFKHREYVCGSREDHTVNTWLQRHHADAEYVAGAAVAGRILVRWQQCASAHDFCWVLVDAELFVCLKALRVKSGSLFRMWASGPNSLMQLILH